MMNSKLKIASALEIKLARFGGTFRQHSGRANVESMWDQEYAVRRTLPNTTNFHPSRCLGLISDMIKTRPGLTVLDLGCGNGRHSSFFAKRGCNVHAVDISGHAIEIAYGHVIDQDCLQSVNFYHTSALDKIPDIANGFDIILDSYMSCHIIDFDERALLLNRIKEALSPSGLFISFGVSLGDSFYSQYANGSSGSYALVCDPITKIQKLLLTEQFIVKECARLFEIHRIGRVPLLDKMGEKVHEKEALYFGAGCRESIVNSLTTADSLLKSSVNC